MPNGYEAIIMNETPKSNAINLKIISTGITIDNAFINTQYIYENENI